MYRLVEAIEAYPQFLPWCAGAVVHERRAGATRATLTAAFGALRQSFSTQNDNIPGEAIRMRLLEGPFRAFEADWRFVPLGEGCRLEFAMRYEFSSAAPAKALAPLFDRIADSMLDAFVRRAAEVYAG